jgi:hypothetical protein
MAEKCSAPSLQPGVERKRGGGVNRQAGKQRSRADTGDEAKGPEARPGELEPADQVEADDVQQQEQQLERPHGADLGHGVERTLYQPAADSLLSSGKSSAEMVTCVKLGTNTMVVTTKKMQGGKPLEQGPVLLLHNLLVDAGRPGKRLALCAPRRVLDLAERAVRVHERDADWRGRRSRDSLGVRNKAHAVSGHGDHGVLAAAHGADGQRDQPRDGLAPWRGEATLER